MRIRLRRVSYRDPQTHRYRVFLPIAFDLPALAIAEIYRNRWQIEFPIRKYPDSDQK